MFEADMERLNHALEDALLYYHVAPTEEEKEACLQRAVEASLDRLQCCLFVLGSHEKINGFPLRVREYLKVSEYVLHEGATNFVRVRDFTKGNRWSELAVRGVHLHGELQESLGLEPSLAWGRD